MIQNELRPSKGFTEKAIEKWKEGEREKERDETKQGILKGEVSLYH